MRAAVLEALRKPLVIKDVPDPQCAPNGAIVRTEAEGVCRSDWHFWMGDWSWIGLSPSLPCVMGHEFCGVVEEVGKEVRGFKRGDRVVVPFSQGDGTCEFCRTGHSNVCNALEIPGITYWGGYGRLVAVPRADLNLVALSEQVSFVEAASLGCRFMTSFHGVVHQAQVQPGEWVAVHGCGGIGLSAINIAAAIGANVIGIDLDDRKLELAKKLGASHVVNVKRTEIDAANAVMDLTGGGAHVSIDALGVATTVRNSIMCLRKRGRHLQIGLTTQAEKGEVSVPIDRMVLMELQLIGTVGMQASHYPSMLKMVEAGKLTPGAMVTERISLEKASDILDQMTSYQNVGTAVITQF